MWLRIEKAAVSLIPAPKEIAKEVIVQFIAIVAVAYIISKVPAVQRLVRGNSIVQTPTHTPT